jgi:hypothetical protein
MIQLFDISFLNFFDQTFWIIYGYIVLLTIFQVGIFVKSKISKEELSNKKPFFLFMDLFVEFPIIASLLKIYFFKDKYFIYSFIALNIFILIYSFWRLRLSGKAWELVLVNKHKKNLDTFMVVIGLIFAASFGAITSLNVESYYMEETFMRLGVLLVYLLANIVILIILTVLFTYVLNTMGNRKPIMITLVVFIGFGLLIQESLTLNTAHQNYLQKIKKKNALKK